MAAARPPLLLFALLLTAAASARPPDDAERARAAAQHLREAEAEEQRLAAQRVVAAAKLRESEDQASALADQVAGLEKRRQEAEQRLAERAAAMAPLLPLAERLGLYPAETLLAVPASPDQTIQGLAVLRGLMQVLEQDAAGLREEQAKIDAAEREIAASMPRLQQVQAAQAVQAAQLDRQIEAARAGRVRFEDAASEAAKRAAAEAAQAQTLRGALATMQAPHARAEQQLQDDAARADKQRRGAEAADARAQQAALARPAGPGIEPGRAAIVPVAGPMVRRWGDPTEAGPARGISYQAPPLGRVVAPCAGRVAFAGPFRSYGVLSILDCGGGYYFVLAGLDRLDVQAGATVQAGEPLGVMPNWDPAHAGQRPALYLELRRDGQPVNPAPFLRGRIGPNPTQG